MAFRMENGMDEPMDQDMDTVLPDWLLSMSEEQRSGMARTARRNATALTRSTEFAYIVLRSLRTSSIAAIVDRLNPLLHIDPVLRLPPEIMFDILRYLDPPTLLRVSTLSKMWRSRATDSRLWRKLFGAEGWVPHFGRIRAHEAAEISRKRGSKERKIRPRSFATDIDHHVTLEDPAPVTGSPASASTSPAIFEQVQPPIRPTLLTGELGGDPKVNWQYLYKQKRRLEDNWNTGKFKNFQLPHPAHP